MLALALAGCGGRSVQPGAPLADFTAHLDARVPALLAHYDIPGATMALVLDGRVAWTAGYGLADVAAARPMTADTVMQIGSISKSVTAWGVMRLVEEGRLELDAPAERYLTRWHLPESGFDPGDITIRRLLSHSAGVGYAIFPRSRPVDRPTPPIDRALADVERGSSALLAFPPGERFFYSNPAYVILELGIEEVTGRPFPEYMKADILNPLGMTDSSFEWNAALRPRTATGYTFDRAPVAPYVHVVKAPGGLYTTAPELGRWLAAGMRGPHGEPPGRGVLQPASVERMYTPVIETTGLYALASDAYAFGHFVETLPDGHRAVMHGGVNRGWMSHFYAVPVTGDGILILTNSQRSQRFFADVSSDWARWRGFGSVKMTRSYRRVTLGLYLAAGVFAVWAVALAWRLGRGIRRRTRRFAPLARTGAPGRATRAALGVALLTGWWYVGRPFVIELYPVFTGCLGLALVACGALLVVASLFPQRGAGDGPAPADPADNEEA